MKTKGQSLEKNCLIAKVYYYNNRKVIIEQEIITTIENLLNNKPTERGE